MTQQSNVSPLSGTDRTPALDGVTIQDIRDGTDAELGMYIADGSLANWRGAQSTALDSAQSLCELLSCIDCGEASDRVPTVHWSRVAWMASSLIDRAIQLQQLGARPSNCVRDAADRLVHYANDSTIMSSSAFSLEPSPA